MECNKDEAIRAKEIAENRMRNCDFEGARKIALKAQNLYSELENISQMLSICDVHCSAQQRIMGSQKDWYGILQVQRLADEPTIKKQYRRLALILHPDKNRFPGAEAAFKLICEANAVLSDATKKSNYDSMVRVSIRTASGNLPVNQAKRNAQVSREFSAQNNAANGFGSLNQQQAKGSTYFINQDVFWTCCPYCKMRYQYHRQFVNRNLCCPSCLKSFMAYELGARGVPLVPKSGEQGSFVPSRPESSKPPAFQPKVESTHINIEIGVQDNNGSSASHAAQQGIPNKQAETDLMDGVKGGKPNGDSIKSKSGDLKSKSRKRSRKLVVESSDSDLEDVTINQTSGDPATDLKSGTSRATRRSSRSKQSIIYNESDDEDLASPLKSSKTSKNSDDDTKDRKDVLDDEHSKHGNQNNFPADATNFRSEGKETGAVLHEETLQDKDTKCDKEGKTRVEPGFMSGAVLHKETLQEKDTKCDKENKISGNTCFVSGAGTEKVETTMESDLDRDNSNKETCEIPDPEFNDFEKGRDATLFKVDQYWALYDPSDGMPRFYAKVKKTSASPFEVSVTWLEAMPINKSFDNWVKKELPVACGTFKFGNNEKISERAMFSHQVKEVQKFTKGNKKCSLIIYPRKGEVWALFRNWDIGWDLDQEKHKQFKYEIVEVLSDFNPGTGIRVGYLDKVEGFVSLFQMTGQSDADSFLIGPDQLYKFSHCVPSFKMSGSERKGVPKDSFELDPASLPLKPDDLCFPVMVKTKSREINTGVHCSPPKSAAKKGKSVLSDSPSTPKKFVGSGGVDQTSKVRRSSKGSNFAKKSTN